MREKMKKESTITIRKCLSATLCTFLIVTGFSAAVPVQARLFEGIKLQSSAKKASRSNTKMLKVVLPTETEHVFDFIMDPEGLIHKTDGAAYDYSSFEEDASVFLSVRMGRVMWITAGSVIPSLSLTGGRPNKN